MPSPSLHHGCFSLLRQAGGRERGEEVGNVLEEKAGGNMSLEGRGGSYEV